MAAELAAKKGLDQRAPNVPSAMYLAQELHAHGPTGEAARPPRAAAEEPLSVSPGWLTIDPNFDPLRKNPRFQKLVAGK